MKYCLYILIILLASCQVQQRKYQPGFYVHHKEKQTRTKTSAANQNAQAVNRFMMQQKNTDVLLGATFNQKRKHAVKDSCDLLVFNDGTEIKAVILSIDDREISYRYCDEPPEKVHITKRKNVVNIRYWNATKNEPPPTKEPAVQTETVTTSTVVTETVTTKDTIATKQKDSTTVKTSTSCSIIYFMDGSEKKANVLEIGVKEIKYKDCSMPDGPLFRELKSKIFMIVYANGTREVIEHKEEAYTNFETLPPPRPIKRKSAVTGFVFALMGFYPLWIIGGLLAIIMGGVYLQKAQVDPETYHQAKLAKASLILGIISTGIIAAFIVLNLR